ncbi:hypothetical protein Tco_0933048 [Tanacetum coccineum]
MLLSLSNGQSSDPNIASFSRVHETDDDPFTSTKVEDEPLGGSFHASPPRSTQAPPAGHTSGDSGGKLVKKVKAMEVKLKTKKRKVVVSDSDQEEGGEQDVDLDALLALANAAVIVDSNIPPGGASSSHIPTDVPTGVAPAGVSNKGKTPMVEEDITVEANASLSKTLLGDDVTEDNFPVRMAALIKRKKQALAEKLAKERMERPMTPMIFEKIQKAPEQTLRFKLFSMTLKRTCPEFEEPYPQAAKVY